MHNIKLVTAVDKNKLASDKTFLVALVVDIKNYQGTTVETLRVVNNNEDVIFEGQTFIAYPFSMDINYEAGSQPTVSLTAQDVSRALMQRMQQYNGAVGSTVTMLAIHEDNLNGPAEITQAFEVISTSSADYTVTWTLGTINLLDVQFPGRKQRRDRCQWVYKGPDCGYTGALATCDFTLNGPNGCQTHNRVSRFGGFPGLNSGRY